MIHERVEPDKIRFQDPSATIRDIHVVEFSDDRSYGHFITFYTKVKPDCFDKTNGWIKEADHNPEMYHRLGPGVKKTIKGKERFEHAIHQGHFHVTFDQAPTFEDLATFKLPIEPQFLEFIERKYCARE